MFFFILFACFFFFFFFFTYYALRFKHTNDLPPGPHGLPIVGHLPMLLGDLPHRSLHKLSQKYGPIMQLRLGVVPTVVVSSPLVAEFFLKTHDLTFANRPKSQVSKCTLLGSKGLIFSEYGPYIANVRKLISVHLLSSTKIQSFGYLRKEEMKGLVQNLKRAAAEGCEHVNISAQLALMIDRISYKMLFGARYRKGFNVKPVIKKGLRLAEAFNVADFLPFTKAFDFQGLNRHAKEFVKFMDDFLERIIHEHEEDGIANDLEDHKDFIHAMLSTMRSDDNKNSMLDRTILKAVVIDMLGGSSETTTATIEWALKELIRHPHVMKRVQEELMNVVGMECMVEEADLAKLPYLHMVVKESMRLHPFAPLIPRVAAEDVSIYGYQIPKKTRVIMNIWAIGRDPRVWSDNAGEFYPERFANAEIEIGGPDVKLIPFGSGRRMCPAIELGLRTVHFVLAQLVHCFDFQLPDGMSFADIDMKERYGKDIENASPLLSVPTHRLRINTKHP